jgi:hypothetical protein
MHVRRHLQSVRLFAALALVAMTTLPGTPDPVSAQTACTYRFYRVNYYAEPEKINLVGVCTGKCNGQTTCTGIETNYETVVYNSACPICV